MLDRISDRESTTPTVRDHREITDEELAERSARGDLDAFAELYERHFAALYDFAFRTVRDRDFAADVVQDTFTKAWQGLAKSSPVKNAKAWLYAIARNVAVDELRRRQRVVNLDDDNSDAVGFTNFEPPGASDPAAAVTHKEMVNLVWSAASGLSASDYTLLDLHVRRDLTVDEISESLGLQKGAVYTRLTRLRHSVEESVNAYVLARVGRRDCAVLDGLLGRTDAQTMTPELRRVITQHLSECERCTSNRRRFVSPIQILAGLAPVTVPAGLKAKVWEQVTTGIHTPLPGPRGDGLGRAVRRLARFDPTLVAIVGVAIVVASTVALAPQREAGSARLRDPHDVHSSSHRIGVRSEDSTIEMEWTPVTGARAYSVIWDQAPSHLPDADGDLPGTAAGTVSPTLDDGEWYFHLRTQNQDGDWTSTVHVGPFSIATSADARRERPDRDDKTGNDGPPETELTTGDGDLVLPTFAAGGEDALNDEADPNEPTTGDESDPNSPPGVAPSPPAPPQPTSSPLPTSTPSPSPTPAESPVAEPTPDQSSPPPPPPVDPVPPPTPEPSEPPDPRETPEPTPEATRAPDPTPTEPANEIPPETGEFIRSDATGRDGSTRDRCEDRRVWQRECTSDFWPRRWGRLLSPFLLERRLL